LWGNPLVRSPTLENLFPHAYLRGPCLRTVGALWSCATSGAANAWPDAQAGLEILLAAQALPAAWQAQCQAVALQPPLAGAALAAARAAAAERVLSSLTVCSRPQASGQRLGCMHAPVPLAEPVSVRRLTAAQADPAAAERRSRLQAFVQEAGVPTAAAQPEAALAVLAAAWRVPCDNAVKETLWRLALDGLPLPGSARFSPSRTAGPCLCGEGSVGRLHCFWECPLARRVAAVLRRNAPPAAALALTRRAVWLAEAPVGVPDGVWRAVVLAALSAMHYAQRYLTSRVLARRQPAAGGAAPGAPAPRATALDLLAVGDAAEERFWSLLHDCVAACGRRVPRSWRQGGPPVTASSPFMCVDAAGHLQVAVRRPQPAPPWLLAAGAPLAPLPQHG
jgi:hypothetical protein